MRPPPSRLRLCLALAALVPALRAAETPPAPPAGAVEELYRGELDDTGPQYLLQPAAERPARSAVWLRTDVSATDNAAYAETAHPSGSSVASLQAGADVRCWEQPLAAGRLTVHAGARTQLFRYGVVGDDDHRVDTLQVDRNNFDLVGAHLRAAWTHGPWLATGNLQGALLRNRSSGRTFYRELAAEAGLFRQWKIRRATLLTGADLGHRWTITDTYGLLPPGWNDRSDAALSALWQQPLSARWAWRATARAAATVYTHADRSRRDATGTLGAELVWALRPGCELRLFVAHERRDSTEPAIPDYVRWEGGAGAGLRWEF